MWLIRLWYWLSSWFVRDSFDVYKPSERNIYRYTDGEKIVHADPMVLYKRIMDIQGDLQGDLAVADSPHSDASKYQDIACDKIAKVFDVSRMRPDGTGLTVTEIFALLDHFMIFCGRVKKKVSLSPITASETSVPSEPSSVENQTTSNSSDSGSTDNDLKTEEPTPLQQEQESLSDQSAPD